MGVSHSPDYVEAMATPNQPRPRLSQNPMLSASERDRLEMYEEAVADLEVRGYKTASVLRFCPWDQTIDGVAHQLKKLPGVPTDAEAWRTHVPRVQLSNGLSVPFTHYVITSPYISVGTRFRGRSENDSTSETKASIDLPIALARDIVGQQNQFLSQGGALCYEGGELPEKTLDARAWVNHHEQMPLSHAIDMAVSRMLTHMNSLISQAEQAYMSDDKNLKREVRGARFRQAVQYMLNAGQISREPEWFTERSEGSKQKAIECPLCGVRVNATALVCPSNHVIDPFRAFGKAYDLTTPGGEMTARRMTRLQLEQLGLYPKVKPMTEFLEEVMTEPDEPKDSEKPAKQKGK